MAKQQHGINDGYLGTVGTVIGYQWRGKWCMRSRPVRVHNPRTPRQQEGRSVFGVASSLAAGFSYAVRLGLLQSSLRFGMTARNLFISLNRPAVSFAGEEAVVDYPSLLVAAGPVAPVVFGQAVRDDASLTVPFERNPLRLSADSTDEVYLFAWCPEAGAGVLSQPVFRRTQEASLALPSSWVGLEVHLYGFVVDYTGRASGSSYIVVNQPDEISVDSSNTLNSNTIYESCENSDVVGGDFNKKNPTSTSVCTHDLPHSEKNISVYSPDNQFLMSENEFFSKKYLVSPKNDCTFAPVFRRTRCREKTREI